MSESPKKQVGVRLNGVESEKIAAICERYGVTPSQVLRAALAAYRPSVLSLAKVQRKIGLAAVDDETLARVTSEGGRRRWEKK